MTAGRPLRVIVLVDALGWTYIEDREFLQSWLPHRQPLPTVLGYSSGAIPTLLTGAPPHRHGHWNLYYYAPTNSPFRWLRPGLGRWLDNRVGRRLLRELGRRALGLGPLFEVNVAPPLLRHFDWIEKKSIYEPGGITGGGSLFDRLDAGGVATRVYTYHGYTDAETLSRAPTDILSGQADFYFLYLSEIDHLLHHHCKEKAVVDERLSWYSAQLGEVFAAARRRDPKAQFTLLSDHGMTPVSDHLPLVQKVKELHLKEPDDYLAVYDATMARYWFFRDEARKAVHSLLDEIPQGRVLSDRELEGFGILFEDRRYGETVFLLKPGWLISDSAFGGGGWTPAGMHGYDPADRWSDGVFLADREPEPPVSSLLDVLRAIGMET